MLTEVLKRRLSSLESRDLLKKMQVSTKLAADVDNCCVHRQGEKLTSFSCNDYMNLSNNESVKKAAIEAINLYGLGAGASRLITGNHPLYGTLEAKLAQIYNTEAALVFSSGYLANIGTISAILGRHDMAVTDQLIHASLIDGVTLSQARMYRFAHNSTTCCAEILQRYRKQHQHCLIIVESVYSMEGDLAPIDELVELARRFSAWVVVDSAHGFGLLSKQQPAIYIGTLSKILGALGGYVCASKTTIEYLQNKARSFIFTTALPPAIVAAASAAVDIVAQEQNIPLSLAKAFCSRLGLPEAQSHIIPITMESAQQALHAESILAQHGFLVAAIRPPTVPTARLRFAFNARHTLSDIYRLCKVLEQEGLCHHLKQKQQST